MSCTAENRGAERVSGCRDGLTIAVTAGTSWHAAAATTCSPSTSVSGVLWHPTAPWCASAAGVLHQSSHARDAPERPATNSAIRSTVVRPIVLSTIGQARCQAGLAESP